MRRFRFWLGRQVMRLYNVVMPPPPPLEWKPGGNSDITYYADTGETWVMTSTDPTPRKVYPRTPNA